MDDVAESPDISPQDEFDESQWRSQEMDESGEGGADAGDAQKPAVPLQKRRRVTRACDECRRKKVGLSEDLHYLPSS